MGVELRKRKEKRKAAEEVSPVAVKKQKSISRPGAGKPAKTSKPKATKAKKAIEEDDEAIEGKDEEDAWSGIEEGDEVDDQTQALVETLDSGDEDGGESMGTYKKGQAVGKAPQAPGKTSKPKNASSSSRPEDRGTIYVGHIPFGFFEHQMREV